MFAAVRSDTSSCEVISASLTYTAGQKCKFDVLCAGILSCLLRRSRDVLWCSGICSL